MREEEKNYVDETQRLYHWYGKPGSTTTNLLVTGGIILILFIVAALFGAN